MKPGWEIKTIGEVCEIRSGRNQKEVENPSGKYPIYGSGGIMGYADDYLCEAGATIIGRKGSINNPIFVETQFWNVDTAFGFSPKETILPKFLFYFCKGFNFQAMNKGTTIPSLVKTDLLQIRIPVPSIQVQQRIVDILDQEFAKIDALKATAEKSLQSAKDLFQAALKKELEPKDGWEKTCLDDVCNIVGRIGFRGYTRNDIVPSPDDGAISLSPSNIVEGEMRYDKLTYISWFKYDESPEIKIFNGDILLVKTGSSYGKSAIIKDLPHEATINPQLVVLKNIKIDTQYLHFFLSTDNAKKKFDEFVSGTAIPTFSQRNLGQMEICFPNPEITLGIVSKLNNLRKRLTSFQENYQKTLTLCDDLKQSLLRKAFNGEL